MRAIVGAYRCHPRLSPETVAMLRQHYPSRSTPRAVYAAIRFVDLIEGHLTVTESHAAVYQSRGDRDVADLLRSLAGAMRRGMARG